MRISVLLEPMTDGRYRVRGGEPFAFSVEGAKREEALERFREQVEQKLANGATVVEIQVGSKPHPASGYAGTWDPDDPVIQLWQQGVEQYRREVEEDPAIP